jgi:hypothetical protein
MTARETHTPLTTLPAVRAHAVRSHGNDGSGPLLVIEELKVDDMFARTDTVSFRTPWRAIRRMCYVAPEASDSDGTLPRVILHGRQDVKWIHVSSLASEPPATNAHDRLRTWIWDVPCVNEYRMGGGTHALKIERNGAVGGSIVVYATWDDSPYSRIRQTPRVPALVEKDLLPYSHPAAFTVQVSRFHDKKVFTEGYGEGSLELRAHFSEPVRVALASGGLESNRVDGTSDDYEVYLGPLCSNFKFSAVTEV